MLDPTHATHPIPHAQSYFSYSYFTYKPLPTELIPFVQQYKRTSKTKKRLYCILYIKSTTLNTLRIVFTNRTVKYSVMLVILLLELLKVKEGYIVKFISCSSILHEYMDLLNLILGSRPSSTCDVCTSSEDTHVSFTTRSTTHHQSS
jgi:hypothetical protein